MVTSLASLPPRGSHPKELLSLGIKEYRQTFFKPYWVIYRVTDSQVAQGCGAAGIADADDPVS